MSTNGPSRELRLDLARRARSKATRNNVFSRTLPSHWSPYSVLNPLTGLPFTDDTAWALISDILERDHPACFVELDIPKGLQAVVIIWKLSDDVPDLYIKIHKGTKPNGDKVFGRSFHYSTKPGGAL